MDDIKVFISYSYDSDEHCERVLALSNRLIKDGLDCILDQYEESPPEGWPMWMVNHIRESDFVLIICTETYYRRTTNQERPGKGLGVKWESVLSYQDIYENDSKNTRFIPVLFRQGDEKYRPDPLKGIVYYCIDSEEGYEGLYRRLTNQPFAKKPPKGTLKKFPSKKPKVEIFGEKSIKKRKQVNITGKILGEKQNRRDDKLPPSNISQTLPNDLRRYTKVDCPKKCYLNDEIEFSVQLTIKKPLETVVRQLVKFPMLSSNESIKLTLQLTAIAFHIDNPRKTMNVPVNDDSEKVTFKMKALSVGDQLIEVEIYFNALRIGYLCLEIKVEDSNDQS